MKDYLKWVELLINDLVRDWESIPKYEQGKILDLLSRLTTDEPDQNPPHIWIDPEEIQKAFDLIAQAQGRKDRRGGGRPKVAARLAEFFKGRENEYVSLDELSEFLAPFTTRDKRKHASTMISWLNIQLFDLKIPLEVVSENRRRFRTKYTWYHFSKVGR